MDVGGGGKVYGTRSRRLQGRRYDEFGIGDGLQEVMSELAREIGLASMPQLRRLGPIFIEIDLLVWKVVCR